MLSGNELPIFNDPSAWKASELLERSDFVYRFEDSETAELIDVVKSDSIRKQHFSDLTPGDFDLPSLRPRLSAIQHSLEFGSGVCWIRGLPIEDLDLDDCMRLLWGVSQFVGTPISQSAKGDLLFHVRDEGYSDQDPRARGPSSRKKLTFHTDRCDVIGFLCRQPAKSGGENELVSSVSLYNRMVELRPDLVQVLLEPYRYQRHNVDQGNENAFYEQPIFSIHQGRFAAFLMQVLIERAYSHDDLPPMTKLQREALDMLASLAETEEFRIRFRQEAGDVLFVNNLTTLHRRHEFVDDEKPAKKRHLIRIWLSMPNSRELTPAFAPSFGATAAGAIRGGMKPR